jgi:hypothetical protein
MKNMIEAVPGDVSTEPVATAQQSHVDGRVGPPTIIQDAVADHFVPEGVEQVKPGAVLPADYPGQGGVVDEQDVEADAVPGDDVKQSQRNGPTRSNADQASKRAS